MGDFSQIQDDYVAPQGNSLSISITARKFIEFEAWINPAGGVAADCLLRFNGDSATNYSFRYSSNGGADSTSTSASSINVIGTGTTTTPIRIKGLVSNVSTDEKTVILWVTQQGAAGAATAPSRVELVGKWTSTAAQITTISLTQSQASPANFGFGSRMTIIGAD